MKMLTLHVCEEIKFRAQMVRSCYPERSHEANLDDLINVLDIGWNAHVQLKTLPKITLQWVVNEIEIAGPALALQRQEYLSGISYTWHGREFNADLIQKLISDLNALAEVIKEWLATGTDAPAEVVKVIPRHEQVYNNLSEEAKRRTSLENVRDVLEAVERS